MDFNKLQDNLIDAVKDNPNIEVVIDKTGKTIKNISDEPQVIKVLGGEITMRPGGVIQHN